MSKFSLGKLVATKPVSDRMNRDPVFNEFISSILKRYRQGDWGDLPQLDYQMNCRAVKSGGRILAAYIYSDDESGSMVWIITESDRSVTTILFADEY